MSWFDGFTPRQYGKSPRLMGLDVLATAGEITRNAGDPRGEDPAGRRYGTVGVRTIFIL